MPGNWSLWSLVLRRWNKKNDGHIDRLSWWIPQSLAILEPTFSSFTFWPSIAGYLIFLHSWPLGYPCLSLFLFSSSSFFFFSFPFSLFFAFFSGLFTTHIDSLWMASHGLFYFSGFGLAGVGHVYLWWLLFLFQYSPSLIVSCLFYVCDQCLYILRYIWNFVNPLCASFHSIV